MGHEEGGQLTERVKRNPYSVVLLDEIEKAHPDVFNVLLQVFEDGHLTDGLGNTIDFKNSILIMTSNIGARFIEKKGRMGFASGDPKDEGKSVSEMVMGEVKRTFNPEFINRLDEIIVFDALTDDDLVKITRLLVEQLNENLKEKGDLHRHPRRRRALAAAEDAHGPLVRGAPAAPGHPAPHRGRAVGGVHPRPDPRATPHRGRRPGRRLVVLAGRSGRSIVGMNAYRRRQRATETRGHREHGGNGSPRGCVSSLFPVRSVALWRCCCSRRAGPGAARRGHAPRRAVDVQGGQFLQKETLLFYVSTKPGERFDERRLKDDFRRLWDTGFLDDMRVDVLRRRSAAR